MPLQVLESSLFDLSCLQVILPKQLHISAIATIRRQHVLLYIIDLIPGHAFVPDLPIELAIELHVGQKASVSLTDNASITITNLQFEVVTARAN